MPNQNSTSTQSSIAVPPNPNSLVPQNLPTFDPYSPFWILIGLAILLERARPGQVRSGQTRRGRRY